MSSENEAPTVGENVPSREEFAAELGRYVGRFGAECGSKWFSEGVSYPDALELHFENLQKEIERLNQQVAGLKEVVQSLDRGDDEGADFVEDDEQPPQERTLRNRIRIQGRPINN